MRRVVSAPTVAPPPTPTGLTEPLQPDGPDPSSDSDKENEAPTYAFPSLPRITFSDDPL
jgi:hypothetical protein